MYSQYSSMYKVQFDELHFFDISCEKFSTPSGTVSTFHIFRFLKNISKKIITSQGNTFKALGNISERPNTRSRSREFHSYEDMSPFEVAKNIWE